MSRSAWCVTWVRGNSFTMWNSPHAKSQEWGMHISHVQSVQVYASVSFEAVSPWWTAFHSWDSACVRCAHDVVTEMDVALRATGVKCDVHRVAEKDAQRFLQLGLSVA